jgi:hypothetical protein
MPAISIDARRDRSRERSKVKSSTKVALLSLGPSALISEELALRACPIGLDKRRLLSALGDKRLCVLLFLAKLIAAPVVRIRT